MGPLELIKSRTIYTIFFASLWLIVSGEIRKTPNMITLNQIIALSILCSLGLYFFIKANKWTSFPVVISINLIGLILQQICAYILLNQQISEDVWIIMPGMIAGIYILLKPGKYNKGIIYALISTFLWALGYSLMSIPLKHSSTIWTSVIMEFTIGMIFIGINYKKKEPIFKSKTFTYQIPFVIMGISTFAASLLIFHAYKYYTVTDISYLYLLYYPLSLIANKIYFKERILKSELIGCSVILASLTFHYLN